MYIRLMQYPSCSLFVWNKRQKAGNLCLLSLR
jgi:hypothetical protein